MTKKGTCVEIGSATPGYERGLFPFHMLPFYLESPNDKEENPIDIQSLRRLVNNMRIPRVRRRTRESRPFASSPIRSRPSRTYDRGLPSRDPEGEYIPTYLARMSLRGGKEWEELNQHLINFGRMSGLFDEIEVKNLGHSESSPFQIRVRRRGRARKGPFRNVVDVGYGISQVLPILTELLRADAPSTFLLQQPEVHLHPSAQAALGSLFCSLAAAGKQLIVETQRSFIDRSGWMYHGVGNLNR